MQFSGAKFQGARFDGGTFTGPVSLENSQFWTVPDFRRSEFQKHVTLHGIEVAPKSPEAGFLGRAKDTDTADKYRRLKELAVAARDHDREQRFFARELKAKRGHETRGLALVSSYLYELASDFGRSLWRPKFGFFAVLFAFGLAYATGFGKTGMVISGLLYSANHLLPFLPGSRKRIEVLETSLFGGPAPDSVSALTMFEGVFGAVFIFLIGLALRNRFRI